MFGLVPNGYKGRSDIIATLKALKIRWLQTYREAPNIMGETRAGQWPAFTRSFSIYSVVSPA